MIKDLDVWATENGYIAAGEKPNGQLVALFPAMFNGQIIVGDEEGVSERYSYVDIESAIAYFAVWKSFDFEDEPKGWIRHQPSDRRRVNGDPTQEFIRP